MDASALTSRSPSGSLDDNTRRSSPAYGHACSRSSEWRMNRTGLGTLVVGVGVVVLAVAACGASAKPRDGGMRAVTLRVGTLGTTKALLHASGQDRNLPYGIEWSVFPTG